MRRGEECEMAYGLIWGASYLTCTACSLSAAIISFDLYTKGGSIFPPEGWVALEADQSHVFLSRTLLPERNSLDGSTAGICLEAVSKTVVEALVLIDGFLPAAGGSEEPSESSYFQMYAVGILAWAECPGWSSA